MSLEIQPDQRAKRIGRKVITIVVTLAALIFGVDVEMIGEETVELVALAVGAGAYFFDNFTDLIEAWSGKLLEDKE